MWSPSDSVLSLLSMASLPGAPLLVHTIRSRCWPAPPNWGTEIAGTVEAAFQATEVEAVSQAPQAPGLPAVLDYLTSEGRIVTIVSNNSTVAIETYLRQAGLDHYVAGVSARTAADITRLKPNPHLLQQAMTTHGTRPGECLMVGDSVTDIHAAHAAGTPVVAYANKPGKHERLAAHHPDAIISELTRLIPQR
ncbi:haloacid dehalogenase superfamily, subfamily IA, variant 3 with third motif having DD or ED/haloacid dehalogenase superfamily, subfamily IA, variant 1 with third motif having Dx(3-4)D or Dx(3-4)E [Saccharomonospora viridis]|nr:haloacid dehalogenase superfamily, subfamily IA, variant 3 with third motif having DD or ED/haloacid dehalogenase superfamily, subfamily IA, variant 1 with third motif having Dx(3-4)D or Dx(3-4)E [Saccharomonospora viridis]